MSEGTKISWCDDSLNFWHGCTKVSAGCAHCYAESFWKRFGVTGRKERLEAARKDALRWNKKPWVCDGCGCAQWPEMVITESGKQIECVKCASSIAGFHRRRVFANSLSDWLDPQVPVEWLAHTLDTVRMCDELTWILCTKRPELWRKRITGLQFGIKDADGNWLDYWLMEDMPLAICLLTSIENQEMADKRIPELLPIPAAVHGLSVEPLLGPIVLNLKGIDWVIVGGESGPRARHCEVWWIEKIVEDCKAAGVPCFVKQDSGRLPGMQGRIPERLWQVKEFPK